MLQDVHSTRLQAESFEKTGHIRVCFIANISPRGRGTDRVSLDHGGYADLTGKHEPSPNGGQGDTLPVQYSLSGKNGPAFCFRWKISGWRSLGITTLPSSWSGSGSGPPRGCAGRQREWREEWGVRPRPDC